MEDAADVVDVVFWAGRANPQADTSVSAVLPSVSPEATPRSTYTDSNKHLEHYPSRNYIIRCWTSRTRSFLHCPCPKHMSMSYSFEA